MNDTDSALDRRNMRIIASQVAPASWKELKKRHEVGEFRMECCGATAIPKSSIRGLQFFAHKAGECATAPESVWHRQGKSIVAATLDHLGFHAEVEHEHPEAGCISDVHFAHAGRKITIEVQHSPQTLVTLEERQERYASIGVECYWLMMSERYVTTMKAMAYRRLAEEYDNVCPQGFQPCLKTIPIVVLDMEPDASVKGVGFLDVPLQLWLESIIANRFVWDDGIWVIRSD